MLSINLTVMYILFLLLLLLLLSLLLSSPVLWLIFSFYFTLFGIKSHSPISLDIVYKCG